MSSKKPLKDYSQEVKDYLELSGQLVGKPQKLNVVKNTVYWTQGRDQQLFQWSIGSPADTPAAPVFSENAKGKTETKLTKEEELLRERMRNLLTGISAYHIRESDGAVFYTNQTNLFIYYTTGPRAHQAPLDVFSYIKDSAAFLKGKPCMHISHAADDPSLTDVVFVHDNNLYSAKITEQLQNEAQPLLVEVTPITTIGDDLHQCGVADYITQEEFARYTGHYENADYIIFSYIDTSMMRMVQLLKDNGVEEMPYPRVGDDNSKTTIAVYDRHEKTYRYLPRCVIEKSIPFDAEYIPRFGFKKKDVIYLEVLSRTQESCATLSYPISSLLEITEKELIQVYSETGGKTKEFFPPLHVEMEQHIPWAWTEVLPNEPIIFGKTFDITLRHASETSTAHYHLYVRPSGGSATSWKPLTSGSWNVKPGFVKVHGDRITFVANAGARLQQRLFTLVIPKNLYEDIIPLDENDIVTISREGEFVAAFAVNDTHVIYSASTATSPARLYCAVFPEDGEPDATEFSAIPTEDWIKVTGPVKPIGPGQVSCGGLPITLPTVVTVKNTRNVPVSGSVFIAPPSAPSRATEAGSPLVLYVYGGPHVQLVYENMFETYVMPAVQCLLLQGISVAVVDNQMSNANGLRAMSICKKNMGHFETADYVSFVQGLCAAPERLGLPKSFKVDPTRVGIYGWSYGGYATLLAMSQAPNVFKMGFSGAPVGDWTLYDTGYTERYMGLLKDSETGEVPSKAYQNSSIGSFAAGFPDEIDRLYIAHGLLDENVHFVNSCHITSALVQNGKPYSMLMYPGERHGLRQNKLSRYHHDAIMIKTFVEKL